MVSDDIVVADSRKPELGFHQQRPLNLSLPLQSSATQTTLPTRSSTIDHPRSAFVRSFVPPTLPPVAHHYPHRPPSQSATSSLHINLTSTRHLSLPPCRELLAISGCRPFATIAPLLQPNPAWGRRIQLRERWGLNIWPQRRWIHRCAPRVHHRQLLPHHLHGCTSPTCSSRLYRSPCYLDSPPSHH